MAIQADVTIQDGITIPSAYIVVEHTSYLKRRMAEGEAPGPDLSGVAYCYPNEAAKNDPVMRFFRLEISKPIDHGKGQIEQLYEALREHPAISNAQDT